MIDKLLIHGPATFDQEPQAMDNLKAVNFIYGANGSGKTTISKVISNVLEFPLCQLQWQNGQEIETTVYNKVFIDENFGQDKDIKGIFTLGKADKDLQEKIEKLKQDRKEQSGKIRNLTIELEGEDGNGGKKAELEILDNNLEDECWGLKQRHDNDLQGAFVGFRNSKEAFKNKILEEALLNNTSLKSLFSEDVTEIDASMILTEIKKRAETVYEKTPELESKLDVRNIDSILLKESAEILKKVIVGKEDVDIAEMIQRLNNSDWVKQGRTYYDQNDGICPFCQQSTSSKFVESLDSYFDEKYEKDILELEMYYSGYQAEYNDLLESFKLLQLNESRFIKTDLLNAKIELFKKIGTANIRTIQTKSEKPSTIIDIDSLHDVLTSITKIVDDANTAIDIHNDRINDLDQERNHLTSCVWKYLLDYEINITLQNYHKQKLGIDKAIGNISDKIDDKQKQIDEFDRTITTFEKSTTSIQPTIHAINEYLQAFGFKNFKIEKSVKEGFYKIIRPNGSDAQDTLSEGERNFITFLYFYHLIKGSESKSGIASDMIVVFDDPVSSLDSDILFIVSHMISDIIQETLKSQGNIKQIFILTHNVYFHREVSYLGHGMKGGNRTYWIVSRPDVKSHIKRHDKNPITTTYALLWDEIRNTIHDHQPKPTIQNCMRRILENYFKILGGINLQNLTNKFEGRDKVICKSLLPWAHAGSHDSGDDVFVASDHSTIIKQLKIFEKIFDEMGHKAHYDMMMNTDKT